MSVKKPKEVKQAASSSAPLATVPDRSSLNGFLENLRKLGTDSNKKSTANIWKPAESGKKTDEPPSLTVPQLAGEGDDWLLPSTQKNPDDLKVNFSSLEEALGGENPLVPILSTDGTVGTRFNPKVEALFKDNKLLFPEGIAFRNDGLYDMTGEKPRQLTLEEAKESLRKTKVYSISNEPPAAAATAAATMPQPPTAAPISVSEEQIEALKAPADAPAANDQLAAAAYNMRSGDKRRAVYNPGVSGAAALRGIAGLDAEATKPSQMQQALDRAGQLLNGLSEKDKEFYQTLLDKTAMDTQDMMSELDRVRQSILDDRAKQDTYLAVGEALALLGHNITRLFAANYGLRKGVDMSGLRFDKYDWSAAQQRYDKRFENAISRIDEQLKTAIQAGETSKTSIIKAMGEKEKATIKAGESELARATALLREENLERRAAADRQLKERQIQQQFAASARREAASEAIRQQRAEQFEKMLGFKREELATKKELAQNRFNLMAQRELERRQAAAAGNQSKAAELKDQNFNDAILSISNTIDEVSKANEDTFTFAQWKELTRRLSEKTMKAGIEVKDLLSPEVLEGSWIPWAENKINKDALRARLRSMYKQNAFPTEDMDSLSNLPSGSMEVSPEDADVIQGTGDTLESPLD